MTKEARKKGWKIVIITSICSAIVGVILFILGRDIGIIFLPIIPFLLIVTWDLLSSPPKGRGQFTQKKDL